MAATRLMDSATASRAFPVATSAPPGNVAAMRARDHDHPNDNALYSCVCGSSFTAPVAAATPCPHCGNGQPW
ncbi:MAG: hypothetical protein F2799_00755 [Actinobacteria bacterium]|nr:hypothetical protein [Actinomycetota bacterium]